jgi:hypothetical protein
MIELELHSLKYEVNYKDKSYIIEAIDYFNNTDETKWIVILDGKQLTKDYVFVHEANKYENIIYNTKDEAVNALKIYLSIGDRLEKEKAQYTKEINIYKQALKLKDFRDKHQFDYKNEYFMSLKVLENNLRSKDVKFIDLSRADYLGVQVRVSTIKEMLILEQAIKNIEEDNNNYYTVVNYTNEGSNVISYNWPLYYYWQVGDEFVRHFAFIKKEEYID